MSVGETCKMNDCPVSARMDGLEKEFDRYRSSASETHRQMFERIGALEETRAATGEKLDNIETKLDALAEAVASLSGRSGKRWDTLVDKLIYAAALAVVSWVAAGMPGM